MFMQVHASMIMQHALMCTLMSRLQAFLAVTSTQVSVDLFAVLSYACATLQAHGVLLT